ncbi:hypothetical protein BH10BDE1_BH10BDE1_08520 [soil metagenome]
MMTAIPWRKFPWLDSDFARARWMYIFGLAYLLVGYLGTNELAALNPWHRPSLPIGTAFDRAIPFVPWTCVFYIMYYPLLGTPLLFAKDAISLTRLTIAQTVMNTFSYVIFLLYPTPIDRPTSLEPGPFYYALDALFRADHPFNTFPSLHVAQACILAFFFFRYEAKWSFSDANSNLIGLPKTMWIFHTVSAALIAASALMIKQHYIADAASGLLLAYLMSLIFFRTLRP